MSLLRDIQTDLSTSGVDVATILRKCKILAARLKSDEFAAWVECELNGYPDSQQIPPYRLLTTTHYGSFANSAWRYSKSAIPSYVVPEKYREAFTTTEFSDGVAKAEVLAKSKGNITIPKPDLVPAIQQTIANMYCQEVWAEIPTHEFQQLLSAVKTRILDFVLKLEQESPEAGDAPLNSPTISQEILRPLVQNIFYGSSIGAIAQNSEDFSQTIQLGASPADIAKLAVEFQKHLDELDLTLEEREGAAAEISVLKAGAKSKLDTTVVRQAARTLRSITEGAIGSLVAAAAQPTIWHWIQQTLTALSK